jgi:hypothetical protein
MKKVKLFVLGASLFGMTAFGVSYLGASEAEAQGGNFECEWNGEHCKNKGTSNICGCEDGGASDQ